MEIMIIIGSIKRYDGRLSPWPTVPTMTVVDFHESKHQPDHNGENMNWVELNENFIS